MSKSSREQELFRTPTHLPSKELIERWCECQTQMFYELWGRTWKQARFVLDYERSSDLEKIDEDDNSEAKFQGMEVEDILHYDRGPMGLSIGLQAAGATTLNSCSGHYRIANVMFAAETSVARKIYEALKKPDEFVRVVFGEEFPCYALAYEVESTKGGAEKLISWGETLYDARKQFS
jgi:hypothetical protein